MYTLIDWISFTVPLVPVQDMTERDTVRAIGDGLADMWEHMADALGLLSAVKAGPGRKMYSFSISNEDHGVTVFANQKLTHALVEITGKGCEMLRRKHALMAVLESVRYRVTRIDIAVDMLTETTPSDFTAQRTHDRMRNGAVWKEDSGETVYVGSYKSDRFARVYRYNPPHERSHLLRSEFVNRGSYAKLGVQDIFDHSLEYYATALGNAFGWSHPDWKPTEQTEERPATFRKERASGKTLFWLADTIAPLLARLHNDGEIDVLAWLEENVIPKLNDPPAQ